MAGAKTDERETNRLIAFDVEGVLIPKRHFLFFGAMRNAGFWGFIRIVALGVLYEIGFLSLESALKRVFVIFRGLTLDEVSQLYEGIPLMPGAEELFRRLNRAGYKTALISSGLPTLLVKDLAARLSADYAFGLDLEAANGYLTGEIGGNVLKPYGKRIILKKIIEEEGLSPKGCVVVADDRNNLSMYPLCALKIGYNPDFILTVKSDFVVRGDLLEILPIVTGNESTVSSSTISLSEILRESIHMGSFSVPFICMYLLGTYSASILILLTTLFYGVSEVARLEGVNFPVISKITWKAANKPELYDFATAPILFASGIVLSLIVFPAPNNYASIAVLTLGDSSATLFGGKFGSFRIPFNKGKNVEGSIFGFLFAFLGAMFFVSPVKALAGAALGILVESLPLPINDNLTIPLASGLVFTIIP